MKKRYFADGRHVKGIELDHAGRDIGKPEIVAEGASEEDALSFAALLTEINRRVMHMCGKSVHWGFPSPGK